MREFQISNLRFKISNLRFEILNLTPVKLALVCALVSVLSLAAQESYAQQTPVAGAYTVTLAKPEDAKAEPGAQDPPSGVRIRVKDADGKPVARKRFFLLAKSAAQSGLDWSAVPSREEFLKGASPELRAWLARHDCDTLYCPEYVAEFAAARDSVPELRSAYAEGLRRYKSPKVALRWITVNFPLKDARTGFYEKKKAWLAEAARRAGVVASVMTDERGEAYFTGVKTGSYYVSNLFPLEPSRVVWDAPVKVPVAPPGKLHSVTVDLAAKPSGSK